jgi:hypothetical protein
LNGHTIGEATVERHRRNALAGAFHCAVVR